MAPQPLFLFLLLFLPLLIPPYFCGFGSLPVSSSASSMPAECRDFSTLWWEIFSMLKKFLLRSRKAATCKPPNSKKTLHRPPSLRCRGIALAPHLSKGNGMIEVRFHGRGGQGARIASRILGKSGLFGRSLCARLRAVRRRETGGIGGPWAKAAVKRLREQGKRIGLARLRMIRPFPHGEIQRVLCGRKGVAVIRSKHFGGQGRHSL